MHLQSGALSCQKRVVRCLPIAMCFPVLSNRFRGSAKVANCGMKWRYHDAMPRNRRSFTVFGSGYSTIGDIFSGSTCNPSWFITNPRYLAEVTENTLFSGFIVSPAPCIVYPFLVLWKQYIPGFLRLVEFGDIPTLNLGWWYTSLLRVSQGLYPFSVRGTRRVWLFCLVF